MSKIQRPNFTRQHKDQNIDLKKLDQDPAAKAALQEAGVTEARLRAADVNNDGVVTAGEAFGLADDFDHDGNAGSLIDVDHSGRAMPAGQALSQLGLLMEKKEMQGTAKVDADGGVSAADLKGISYGDRFGKDISLTFDDGPHPVNTPKVLDILQREGVKATFFVQGQNVAKNPELIRRMVAEGHTLGNHTWDHANLSKASPEKIRDELRRTQDAVDQALGYHYELKTMRPPYGATNSVTRQVLAAADTPMILWQVDTEDWKNKNNDQAIKDNVFDNPYGVQRRGGAILFHDIHPQTIRVLENVIDQLKEDDYKFNTIEQLLEKKYGEDVFEQG